MNLVDIFFSGVGVLIKRLPPSPPVFFSLIVLFSATLPMDADAHFSGTLGVDHYVCISPTTADLKVLHDVHLGEIPAAALRARLDKNGDGDLDSHEMRQYFQTAANVYASDLKVSVSNGDEGRDLDLRMQMGDILEMLAPRMVASEEGGATFRYTWRFVAEWPDFIKHSKYFKLSVSRVAEGFRKASWIFAFEEPSGGWHVLRSSVPDSEIQPMPPDQTEPIQDTKQIPNYRSADLILGIGSASAEYSTASNFEKMEDEGFSQSATDESSDQTLDGREVALRKRIMASAKAADGYAAYGLLTLLCFVWGAMHAFGPGHGKVIAGSYLIGARASYMHAVMLAVLMTITHTSVILVLSGAALVLKDKFVYPEWLQTVGAVLILLVGVRQILFGLRKSLGMAGHNHNHDHSNHGHGHHSHSHATQSADEHVTARDIGALGLSGGMVPCPAAIVLLLLTWQIGRPGLGFVLIGAFSIGLATTLIAVGFLAIYGTKFVLRWLSKRDTEDGHHAMISSIAPLIGGILLLVFGTIILMG